MGSSFSAYEDDLKDQAAQELLKVKRRIAEEKGVTVELVEIISDVIKVIDGLIPEMRYKDAVVVKQQLKRLEEYNFKGKANGN